VVNDLDLELVAPSSTVRRAWVLDPANPHLPASTGTNVRDNQEQVVVKDPEAGSWTVRVVGRSVPSGPQPFALAYSAHASPGAPSTTTFGFEQGSDGFTLSGASRVASPAPGHGSFSLRFGGFDDAVHEAHRDVAIPAGVSRAELGFYWYMTTNESPTNAHWDFFVVDIRSTSGAVLSTVDLRSDGWPRAVWMQEANVDLTPWAGQTVRVAFRATTDSVFSTTFWLDDVTISSYQADEQTFTLSASPSSVSVTQGSSAGTTVTVASLNGFNAGVSLSASGLPGGVTASFSPNPVTPPANGNASSTLTFTASATATTGTFTVTVSGTSGSLTRSTSVTLTINPAASPGFTLSLTPTSQSVPRGTTATYTVNINRSGGFTGAVALSLNPTGPGVSFTPNPASGSSSTLTIPVPSGASPGTYSFTVTGTSGSLTRSTTGQLTVQ
jgi:hypothetical protein